MTALRKYTDWRQWLRQLAKSSVHAGTAAILATLGTNTAEAWAPQMLAGVGFDWRQLVAAFVSAAVISAIQKINQATAETAAPFEDPTDPGHKSP